MLARLLGRLGVGLLVAGFILFPFVIWGLVLSGNFDMSAPMDDPYVSADDGPGTRQALRYGGYSLWTLASITVALLLLREGVRSVRRRRAGRRFDPTASRADDGTRTDA